MAPTSSVLLALLLRRSAAAIAAVSISRTIEEAETAAIDSLLLRLRILPHHRLTGVDRQVATTASVRTGPAPALLMLPCFPPLTPSPQPRQPRACQAWLCSPCLSFAAQAPRPLRSCPQQPQRRRRAGRGTQSAVKSTEKLRVVTDYRTVGTARTARKLTTATEKAGAVCALTT